MAGLIWMLTLLPPMLSAMSELPQPDNLTMTSENFSYVLKWQPGPRTPTGVYYHVSINTDKGTSWVPVAGCEGVQQPLLCNLTDAIPDPRKVYLVRVRALLEGKASPTVIYPGFTPIKESQLALPLLTVTPCGRDLCVDFKPPMERQREIYDTLNYKLKIKCDRAEFFRNTKSLRRQILQDLAPGRQYCVSICISDSLESKESNYSQPVCAFTSGVYTADKWISAVLSLLVMFTVVCVALLFFTGFICLKRRPLPMVLTSIHHIEGVAVIARCSTALSSLLIVTPTLPSTGETRNNQSLSDGSDAESETESIGGSRGCYKLRVGTNLLSSSSSSSSSPSAHLSLESEPPPSFSSNQSSDFFSSQPDTHSSACLNHALSIHTDIDSLTVGTIKTNKEPKEMMGEEVSQEQDVNLLTLTFSRQEEDLNPVVAESESHFVSKEYNMTPVPPSQNWDTREVAIETVPCSADEEGEEPSGYMGRPTTNVFSS